MFPLVVFLSCLTPRNSNNNKKPLKCAPKTQQKNNPREKENMFLVYSMLNSDLEAEGLISNWNKINLDNVTFTYECFLPQSFSGCSLDAVKIFFFLCLFTFFDYQAV